MRPFGPRDFARRQTCKESETALLPTPYGTRPKSSASGPYNLDSAARNAQSHLARRVERRFHPRNNPGGCFESNYRRFLVCERKEIVSEKRSSEGAAKLRTSLQLRDYSQAFTNRPIDCAAFPVILGTGDDHFSQIQVYLYQDGKNRRHEYRGLSFETVRPHGHRDANRSSDRGASATQLQGIHQSNPRNPRKTGQAFLRAAAYNHQS